MSQTRLPRLVAAIVGRSVPAGRRAEVLLDLEDDYLEQRRRHRGRAGWWLAREAMSVAAAFTWARVRTTAAPLHAAGIEYRLAWRAVRRQPHRTLLTAVMLGAGLSAVAIVSALAIDLLGTPVGPDGADRLLRPAVVGRDAASRSRFSFAELEILERQLPEADRLVAANMQPAVLRVDGTIVHGLGEVVTPGFFAVMRPTMMAGRALLAGDDRPDAPPAAVIGEQFWRARFGDRPSALGATLIVNSMPFTIVGVAAARAAVGFGGVAVDVWIPSSHGDAMLNAGWRTNPGDYWWTPVLGTDAGREVARTRLERARNDLRSLAPGSWAAGRLELNRGFRLVGPERRMASLILGVLGALAGLMLAVSAASVSGLFLAAAARDRQRAAIHLALGAGGAGLVQRRALEGLIVGIAGGFVALAAYVWARTELQAVTLQPGVILRLPLPLGATAVGAIIGLGGMSGLLLSLGPATWAARVARHALESHRAARGTVHVFPVVRRALVSLQVALSVSLVIGAAVAAQSLARLGRIDAGFERHGLVAMDFDVEPAGVSPEASAALAADALAAVRRLPGVTGAAMANRAPVDPSTPSSGVRRPGQSTAAAVASISTVTDGYFSTVGIPLLAGRGFRDEEVRGALDVAIVNEALAARLWPDGRAIGAALVIDSRERPVRVIGVARSVRVRRLTESGRPQVYVPVAPAFSLALLARSTGNPREALGAIQGVLDGIGPGVVGFFPRTMDDHVASELLPSRVASRAASTLGALALVLTTIGLYGVAAWFVEVRRREIGVRLALGAAPSDVKRLVLRQAVGAAAPGAAAGVVVGIGLTMAAVPVLAATAPLEPLAIALGVVSVVGLVGIASYVPCRRAAGVDPVECLKD